MVKFISLVILSQCFLAISACNQQKSDPEVQVRSLVSAMETAVENRSLDEIKELIDDGYSDEWNGSRRSALRALMFYYQGHQTIHLLTRINDIKFNDDSTAATVVVYVGMAAKRAESSEALLDLNADLYRFEIKVISEDDDWVVKNASWQRARPENFGL